MISKNMFYKDINKNDYNYLDRFVQVLNDEQMNKLFSAKIIIFGVGGVGSALAQFLVRSGVQNLDIVDFDRIDITNLNRQLLSFQSNVGKMKVEVMKKQLLDINPKLNINIFPIKLSQDNINIFNFDDYDIVLDCIDDINAKKLLIKTVCLKKKYILSAMGAGKRYIDSPQFEVVDITKTSYDPIAKIIRKFCVQEGINKLDVCYTKQKPCDFDCQNILSVVYYPVNMATVICAKIINKLITK